MNITNIQIKNFNIDLENSQFKQIISNNKHLLPNLTKQSVVFDLLNSNEAFANSIRRVFVDELPVRCLNVPYNNIITNDKFILPDNIAHRLSLIPILQDIDMNSTFSLNVTNDTNDIINIYSRDLINKNKNDTKKYFNGNIQICSLKPNRYLNITNIKLNIDYGYNNAVYTIGSFKYEIINIDFNISSLNNTLKDFRFELINNSNISIKGLINLIHETLYIRLKKIQDYINDYKIENNSNDINKINNDIFIIKNNNTDVVRELVLNMNNTSDNINLYEIHIKNESHTIGNLITKYVYLLQESIEHISYRLHHPSSRKLIITINHSDYKTIINDAINNIISDLNKFKNSFK
jgi:DNA-directed RNA polymerase subunit L